MSKSTAVAAVAPSTDELAGYESAPGADDGLGEVDHSDIRIPALVFNFKGIDKAGNPIPPNAFYNTVDETVQNEIDAAFLLLKKTNLYSRFNNSEQRTEILCRSFDRVTGIWAEDGHSRPCNGCPDAQWRNEKDEKGNTRRVRNCSEVYNVFGVDRKAQQPFVMRFKRSSLPVFKQHLQKHHLGRRVANGKRSNYPLYAFQVRVRATMASPNHAVPVIEKLGALPDAEIRQHEETTLALHQQMMGVVQRADEIEARATEDASFDYGENAPANDNATKAQIVDTGDDFAPSTSKKK
jgi:hypothetical protein